MFYLNSLNIQICVSQRSRESNGIRLSVVIRIMSHNYDITDMCPDSIVLFHNDISPSGEQPEHRI